MTTSRRDFLKGVGAVAAAAALAPVIAAAPAEVAAGDFAIGRNATLWMQSSGGGWLQIGDLLSFNDKEFVVTALIDNLTIEIEPFDLDEVAA